MTEKPTYLGLLNAIANGEGEAHKYLTAWAKKTADPAVKEAIRTVALREGEHAHAFEKRMWELGYSLKEKKDPKFEKKMEIAASDMNDYEKFKALGFSNESRDGPDIFSKMFDDKTIDIQTGALLGRYIAEERDSGRILRSCYESLQAKKKA